MNVYEKLLIARIKLQESPIKKTGKNGHLKFDYFELADFLPTINHINAELKLASVFSITDNIATLTVVDAEKFEDQVVFSSPTAQAKLQGNASPIQELGSQHTYMRRYLYLLAYEIIENDVLDAQIGSQQTKPQQQTNTSSQVKMPTDAQLTRMRAIASKSGKSDDEIKSHIATSFNKHSSKELTVTELNKLIDWLEGK